VWEKKMRLNFPRRFFNLAEKKKRKSARKGLGSFPPGGKKRGLPPLPVKKREKKGGGCKGERRKAFSNPERKGKGKKGRGPSLRAEKGKGLQQRGNYQLAHEAPFREKKKPHEVKGRGRKGCQKKRGKKKDASSPLGERRKRRASL